MTKPISRLGWFIIERMSPGDPRRQLRHGMQETLRGIKESVEATAGQPDDSRTAR